MKPLVIARANIVRMLRDRSGLFFIFALPVVIIVVFGLAFGGGGRASIGIVDADGSALSQALVADIEGNRGELDVRRFASTAEMVDAVQRNTLQLGVTISAGYDAAIRGGDQGRVETVGRDEAITAAVRPIVNAAIGREAAIITAARYAAAERGIAFDEALAVARRLQPEIGGVSVATESTGEQLIEAGMNGYVMGAQSQLVLFMFLTSMTAATQLIVSRQLGVSRRMFSTPTGAGTIILGETLGRFGVAMIQGLFIFVGTALVFGVQWGDPLAAGAVIVAFGLVGTGVAMLVGSVATNPEQASSVGVGAAMLLGAFGGAMVPPEVFPDVMRTVSHITPHAWAIDALRDVALRDRDLVGIAPQLAILVGFGAVLLALATVRFRRAIQG
ncbi:MAG TPA: ABC transporter permease [Candidatus Limnocylindrales bacterium]|nr:ABC transporter permease [Candidatus Limnocylindrales bacterium]